MWPTHKKWPICSVMNLSRLSWTCHELVTVVMNLSWLSWTCQCCHELVNVVMNLSRLSWTCQKLSKLVIASSITCHAMTNVCDKYMMTSLVMNCQGCHELVKHYCIINYLSDHMTKYVKNIWWLHLPWTCQRLLWTIKSIERLWLHHHWTLERICKFTKMS